MSTPPIPSSLSLAAFDQRARSGERLSIVFFGGSLTWGAQATDPQHTSYRARMGRKFEETYPLAHFRFWDAAIGGTGSQLGAFRLERDVLARKPDLVFLEFTLNDTPYSADDLDRLASYESLVRRLVGQGIPVVQVILAVKKDMLPTPPPRPLDEKHREIARAYNLPSADAVSLMRERVLAGQADPNVLWPMSPDETHPGDEGYALYAEAAWKGYEEGVRSGMVCRLSKGMIHTETYMTVNRQKVSALSPLPAGWKVGRPNRSASAFDFVMSRWFEDETIAGFGGETGKAPDPLRLKIRGKTVHLFGEMTPSSGKYEVRIDGGEPTVHNANAKGGNMRLVQLIAQFEKTGEEHRIEIVPILEAGEELRLESICVAGAPAEVSL